MIMEKETNLSDKWKIWESKVELMRAIKRNNDIGARAIGNNEIFDRCLERNLIMLECLRKWKKK